MGAQVGRSLGSVAVLDLIIQMACFVVAAALQTEKFYDLSGSATYILCVLLSLRKATMSAAPRAFVNSSLVLTWAARLGCFLFWRILKDGSDRRFDHVKDKPRLFIIFWLVQALWIFLTALPVYLVNAKASCIKKDDEEPGCDPNLSWRDYLGWSLWVTGFVIQSVADFQKSRFRANPENREKWIDEGLWHYSQHPNYFGEMSMWWGIFLSSSQSLRGLENASIISPLFVTFLLTQVSGIPMLRKANMKRWGDLPEYAEYLRTTPLLIPLPFLKG
eukprot:gnl/MRDRNA2_/MRDRNA2_68836_c0_seq1.p1 gnl/MRDRNA2_/MRDRNA2_68836_c0~~gnl/MRDRNA2_/MRDRNA2_68836_c0_seq1.p1  ORF type:complete len:275 (-),score=29.43 gnl/MRDRNA2_/MRDRNA2_68836_c0_seq1:24-848(-)